MAKSTQNVKLKGVTKTREGTLQFGPVESKSTLITTDWFREFPLAREYKGLYWTKAAATDLSGDTITINLPQKFANKFYLPNKMHIHVAVQLFQLANDGKRVKVTTNSQAAPVNNIVGSLFKSVNMTLNGTSLSRYQTDYSIKSFMINLLGQSSESKLSELTGAGWFEDSYSARSDEALRASDSNFGFQTRRGLFLEQTNFEEYTTEPVHFVAPLHHELSASDVPIWNQFQVGFEFVQTPHKFRLLTNKDNVLFELQISELEVWATVAEMREDLLADLRLKIDHNDHCFKVLFDNFYIQSKTIERSTQSVTIPDVFPAGALVGKKLYVMFVEARAYAGHFNLNPYAYKRRWLVSDTIPLPDDHVPDLLRPRPGDEGDDDARRRRRGLRERFNEWQERRRLRNAPVANEDDPPPPYPGPSNQDNQLNQADVGGNPPTHFYIKECTLLLDGQPFSPIDGPMNEHDCWKEFFTFQSNESSFEQSAYSNGISYDKYRGGLFIRSYDLTGCKSSGWPGVLSQVRLGSYTLKVELSYPAPRQLRVIFLSVCPSFCLMNTKDVSATLGLIQ